MCIKHSIINQSKLSIYSTLLWPHLEYCMQFWASISENSGGLCMHPEERETKLVKEQEDLSCEESLRSLFWRKGGWGLTLLFPTASWGGEGKREMLTSSPWNPVTRCTRKASFKAVSGEVQTEDKEAWGKGGQTSETSLSNWSVPKATVQETFV